MVQSGGKAKPGGHRQTQVRIVPTERKPDFLFIQDGDGYQIAAFGESGHVKASRGLLYIDKLLRVGGKAVPWHELLADNPSQRPTTAAVATITGSQDEDESHWSEPQPDKNAGFHGGQSQQEIIDPENEGRPETPTAENRAGAASGPR